MEISLTLPGVPRTKKTSQQIVRTRSGRMVVLPSAEYLAWFKEQMTRRNVITHQLRSITLPLRCAVAVQATIYTDGGNRSHVGDLAGYLQAIGDLLQADKWSKPARGKPSRQLRKGLGIILDDNLIDSWDGSRRLIDAAHPRCDLTIQTLSEFTPGLFSEPEGNSVQAQLCEACQGAGCMLCVGEEEDVDD